jgi:lantibiotic modifying enzyme
MLLCLLHALAVSDIHYENVISSGEHPVVVDLETLLDIPPCSAVDDDSSKALKSVLDTGMLPRLTPSDDRPRASGGAQQDLSALGARSVDVTGFERTVWAHANTDQMMLVDGGDDVTADPTPIRIDGKPVAGSDYIEDVQSGFRDMYGTLSRNAGEILQDNELLSLLNDMIPRVLIRNTSTYSRLQHHLLHPEFLGDGRDRTLELEWLARPLSAASLADNSMLDIYSQELSAMEELDVPYFNARSVSRGDIADDQSEFAELFLRRRDATAFIAILGKLDQENLQSQLELIKESLSARFADDGE